MQLTVEPVDPTAQVGLDTYRGFMEIYCMRKVLTTSTPRRNSGAEIPSSNLAMRLFQITPRSRKARFAVTTERTQLARIVVKIPKTSAPVSSLSAIPKFDFVSKGTWISSSKTKFVRIIMPVKIKFSKRRLRCSVDQ